MLQPLMLLLQLLDATTAAGRGQQPHHAAAHKDLQLPGWHAGGWRRDATA
jgi:hypothetical protein